MSAARLTGMEKCRVTLGSTGAWKAAASMVTKVANSRAMKPTQGLAILLFIGGSLDLSGKMRITKAAAVPSAHR